MLRVLLFFLVILMSVNTFGAVKTGVGIIVSSVESNIEVTDNKKINVHGRPDNFQSDFIPVVELVITKKSKKNTFFAGTDFSEGFKGISAGVKTENESGKMTFVLSFDPFKKVWEDPYITGKNRTSTTALGYGGSFKFSEIKKSGFSLKYSALYTDIRDEKVVFDDLKRDSLLNSFLVDYKIDTGLKSFFIVPEFGLKYNSAVGKSNSYRGYFGGISGVYADRYKRFFMKIGYENDHFSKKDPIFLKTRDDKVISATTGATFRNILNNNKLYATVVAGYSAGYSNINFYHETKMLTGVVVGYEF